MTIFRWLPERDPFSEWAKAAQNMDRVMRNIFGEGAGSAWSGVYPPLNLSEDDHNLYVRAEIPGVAGSDLDVSVEGESFILKGERRIAPAEGVAYHRRERTAGTFRRVLSLPVRIDPAKVTAQVKDGVLTVTLPKAEEAKPRQIKIATA